MKNITIVITSCILLFISSLKAQDAAPTITLTPKTDSLPKIKEFGFGFSSLFSTSYSLQYRWGTEKRLFRVNGNINGFTAFGKSSSSGSQAQDTLSNTSGTSNTKTKTPLSLSSSLSISMLHIKYLVKKFGIIYGPLVGITYSNTTNQSTSPGTATTYNYYPKPSQTVTFPVNNTTNTHSETIQPYIGFAFGAFYKINKSFFLYAEIAPNVYYQRLNSTSNTTNINSYNPPPNTQYQNYYNSVSNAKSSTNTFGVSSLANTAATLTLVYRITKKQVITPHLN